MASRKTIDQQKRTVTSLARWQTVSEFQKIMHENRKTNNKIY